MDLPIRSPLGGKKGRGGRKGLGFYDMASLPTTIAPSVETVTPIVIDLGKKKKKQLRDLKRGQGKLVDEVSEVLERVRADMGAKADAGHLVPVVMIYRKKQKSRRRSGFFG